MGRLGLSFALFLASVSIAMACPGQTGKVIFKDDFSDDSGGWEPDAHIKIADGALQIIADPKVQTDSTINITFNATEGDYCLNVVFPSEPPKPGNGDDFGLYFLYENVQSKYSFNVSTDGTAWIYRTVNNEGHYLMSPTKYPELKTAPGSSNELRVIVKDQKITFFLNGKQIKALRAPVTPSQNKFGFWAGSNSAAPEKERITLLKSFEVTEAP